MGTALYFKDLTTQKEDIIFVAGASAAEKFWLPIIQQHKLDLLQVAFTGGLTITDEYYSLLLHQLNTVLSKFREISQLEPAIEDSITQCNQLIITLQKNPPTKTFDLYLG